ncbi:MAG TPA: hypothetical protein PLN72_05830 [bacterium]|nr:hypothetical protein [bacterium]HPM59075.1 hypothetical protein [bacterium]
MKNPVTIAYNITITAVVLFILAIGVASVMDFHEDGKQHDDCPLCRFDMDGHMLRLSPAWSIIKPLLLFSFSIDTIQTIIFRVVNFGLHLPNAPPLFPASSAI